MATRKKKTDEEPKKPAKKRTTKRKASTVKKKKPTKVEEPVVEAVEETRDEEPRIESSVPPDFFEHQEEVSSEIRREEPEEKDDAPEEEVTKPAAVSYPKVRDFETIQDKIDSHVAELDETLSHEPKERELTLHDKPIESMNREPSMSKWYPRTFYLLLGIACIVGVYAVLGSLFSSTLLYEFTGTRTPLPTIEDTEKAEDMVEILSTPTGYLRVRSGPDTSHDEVAKVFPGERYVLLGEDGEWLNIQLSDDSAGWVFAEYGQVIAE